MDDVRRTKLLVKSANIAGWFKRKAPDGKLSPEAAEALNEFLRAQGFPEQAAVPPAPAAAAAAGAAPAGGGALDDAWKATKGFAARHKGKLLGGAAGGLGALWLHRKLTAAPAAPEGYAPDQTGF